VVGWYLQLAAVIREAGREESVLDAGLTFNNTIR
jgi:hypothetical protein